MSGDPILGEAAAVALAPAAEALAATAPAPADPAATAGAPAAADADPWTALAASLGVPVSVPLGDPTTIIPNTAVRAPPIPEAPTIVTIPPLLPPNDQSNIRRWNVTTPTNFSRVNSTRVPKRMKTPWQLALLMRSFSLNPRPIHAERARLARETTLSLQEVDIWFMNTRKRIALRAVRQNAQSSVGSAGSDAAGDDEVASNEKIYDGPESVEEEVTSEDDVKTDYDDVCDEAVKREDTKENEIDINVQHGLEEANEEKGEESGRESDAVDAQVVCKTEPVELSASHQPPRKRMRTAASVSAISKTPPRTQPAVGASFGQVLPIPSAVDMMFHHLAFQHEFMLRQIGMAGPDSILRPPPPLPPLPPPLPSHPDLAMLALFNLPHQPYAAQGGFVQNAPASTLLRR
ncbi:hypothetical protein HDU86_003027 [Geranomyces michiganensis]|nr:hypothetical protein HDU86_003027 [Geranomyces michiganensis]